MRLLLTSLLVLLSCHAKPPALPVDHTSYQDHTIAKLSSREDFLRFAAGDSRQEVKFIIADFTAPSRQLFYLDSQFYQLHDEWYWFRLLNGQRIPGLSKQPEGGLQFGSIREVYEWAQKRRLPLDLDWAQDGRLYSKSFYPDSFGRRRFFGIGSLLYVHAAQPEQDAWLFQLEFSDNPTEEQLKLFFTELQRSLPEEIAAQLHWVVRSPAQERLAKTLEKEEHPLAKLITRPSSLELAKSVEVYNEGITAGYLRLWKSRPPRLGETNPEDILVLQYTPDFLPTAAGIITVAPQTPLAHLNLLAKNRQIPNAYIGDAFQTDEYKLSSRANQPVILQASGPNQLKIVSITEAQLAAWKKHQQKQLITREKAPTEDLPLMYSIDTISLDKLNDIRAQIGGKAAGFVLLSSQPEIETPPDVAVITTRAYEEHLQSFAEVIALFLKDKEFQASPLLRFLVLEGKKRFIAQHPTKKSLMRRFLRRHRGDALQALIEGGGLTRAIRKKPIAPKTLQAITAALEAQFAALSPAQGLRFRSSSTVEDIEGFNGAGLYLSSSGFLHPGAQTPKKDKKKSVERAIKEVWASYWSFEATEERQQEAIDHLSGAMAIVVHPRFEDEAERANGVLTFSLLPDGQRVMRLNVQAGSQSVTNPDSRELPEQDEVTQQDTATPIIQRSRSSTLSAQHLLSDAQLLALFSQTRALTEAALSKSNQGLSAAQRQRTMTLDVEFRVVQEGWPKLASAEVKPSRIIIKQARSLEPEARGLPPWLYQEEIPRDLLARARKLEEFTCTDQDLTLRVLSLNTSPSLAPDFGYAQTPFTAWLKLSLNGKEVTLYQRDFTKLERPILRGAGAWSLRAVTNEAAAKESKLAQLNVDLEKYSLWTDTNEQRQGSLQCEVKTLFITPTSYLLDLLQSAPKE